MRQDIDVALEGMLFENVYIIMKIVGFSLKKCTVSQYVKFAFNHSKSKRYCLPSEVFDKKMASRFVVQTTAKRQFAAQAAVARTEHVVPKAEPLKVSTLKNGLTVASVGNLTADS